MFITSNDFLYKIVTDLKLNINYFEKGKLQNKVLYDVPFVVKPNMPSDSLPQMKYDIKIVKEGFIVNNASNETSYIIRSHNSKDTYVGIPFKIELTSNAKKNLQNYINKEYVVTIESTRMAVSNLKYSLSIQSFESPKTNLSLTHKGINPVLSRKILDKLIDSLDKELLANKQKKLEKTVTYLSKLIVVFAKEKDSIEKVKEHYLSTNNIYVLDEYISTKTSDKTITTSNSLSNERQIALTRYAINDISRSPITSVLGTDYNLEAPSVNQMLQNYNSSLMESEMLLQRAQKNNPAYLNVKTKLKVQEQAMLNTLED